MARSIINRSSILLLQPRLGYWDSWRTAPAMPLGLLHAGSFIANHYSIEIYDQRLHKDWEKELLDTINRTRPFLIGTTMHLGPAVCHAMDMMAVVREVYDGPIVTGGILPSLIPEICLDERWVDFVVQGEGEQTLLELAQCVENGSSPAGIPGLWHREGGILHKAERRSFLDMETLPEIPYEILQIDKNLPKYRGESVFYMETSRGCPLKCSYCFNPVFNHGVWRKQSASRVRERLEFVKDKYGIGSVYFVDDSFFIDKERGMSIAKAIGELGMAWQIQGVSIQSIKRMTSDDLKTIYETGLRRMSIGIESGSPRLREYLGKTFTNEDVKEVVSKLRKFGFVVYCSFMCNLPTETREDLKQSISLVFELIKSNPNFRTSPFYCYVPAPGTELYKIALEHGYKPPETLEGWGRISNDRSKAINSREFSSRFYRGLYLATLFCDCKPKEYIISFALQVLAFLYRPIACLRLKRMFFRLMPEIDLFQMFARPDK